MCTAEEVKKIVHTELENKIGQLITRIWWAAIGLVVIGAGGWFSLYFQVQENERRMEASIVNTDTQIGTLRDDLRRDITEMKDDIRFIRDRLIQ